MRRAALLLVLAAPGCGDPSWMWEGGAGGLAFGDGPWDPADVAGVWTLTGDGERWGCESQRYDAESLHLSSLPLHVEQEGDRLWLKEEIDGFEFYDGEVTMSGVRFSTSEDSEDGLLTYRFTGQTHGTRQIQGDFTGSGPGTCSSGGTFSVYIQPGE